MENISDEIKIIDAEIEKTEKDIKKVVEDYNEVSRQRPDYFETYTAIPPDPSGAYKETKKILVDAILDNSKALNALRNTMKALQMRLDTLKKSRESKLNKIVHKEDDGLTSQEGRNTASKPQTPAGAAVNPTAQVPPEARDTASTSHTQDKSKAILPFPTPPGTQWHEVTISFIDSENVMISAKGKSEQRHYFDIGFRKGRASKPVASWTVLNVLIEKGCVKYTETCKAKVEKSIQDLRKRLKAIFGIQDDPITLENGYKPKFKVCEYESEKRSIKPFLNSNVYNDEKDDD